VIGRPQTGLLSWVLLAELLLLLLLLLRRLRRQRRRLRHRLLAGRLLVVVVLVVLKGVGGGRGCRCSRCGRRHNRRLAACACGRRLGGSTLTVGT